MYKCLFYLFMLTMPTLGLGAADVSPEALNATNSIGKAIGGVLFGYIVMKIMNRNKDADEKNPRGVNKFLVVALILVILLAIFH